MYNLRSDVYDYLEKNPGTATKDLIMKFGVSGRSSRRYLQHFRNGTAVRYEVKDVRAVSQSMEDYETQDWDVHKFLELAPSLVEQADKNDPIITHDEHRFKVDKPIGIIFASCMHLGGRYTAYDKFREVFRYALDTPGLYFAMLGDDIEGFLDTFRDQDAIKQQLIPLNRQLDVLEDVLSQLKDANKLLFGSGSQHGGKWLLRDTGENPIKRMYMDTFEVPFYDGPAYLKIHVGEQTYHAAVAHEFPGNSAYNPNHPQKKALWQRFPMADMIVMGDKHTPAMQYQTVYQDEVEAGNRKSPGVWLLQSGTLKTGPDRFGLQLGFPKGEFGWPIVLLHPDHHYVEVTLSLYRERQMLGNLIKF